MTTIQLYNTATRRKEVLEPLVPGRVGMYLCGPTVYDRAHLGNARNVILFDVLLRLLRHVYGTDAVTYVRNFTDVDDKINARAAETGRPIRTITDETTRWYLDDMAALGALEPTHMPRATDHIGGMIALIERLIARGHAYEAAGHVLFSVNSYPDYGKFSGRSVDDMLAGARVDVAPYKRDPMDFVLWKPSDPSLPGWDSPWGRGRPGWHIECSAMSFAILGPEFDIHGGGLDLMFPHHENEIAQSVCATGGGFARLWMHNEMLLVEGRKMSKSLGNFFTVRDLLNKGVRGEVIRFVFLMTHYRKAMDWTENKAKEAMHILEGWDKITSGTSGHSRIDPVFLEFLFDDLNTPGAISRLHEIAQTGDAELLKSCGQLIGLFDDSREKWLPEVSGTNPLSALLREREEARARKDFAKSDQIRDFLKSFGISIADGRDGKTTINAEGYLMFDYFNGLTISERKAFLARTDEDLWEPVSIESLREAFLKRVAKLAAEKIK